MRSADQPSGAHPENQQPAAGDAEELKKKVANLSGQLHRSEARIEALEGKLRNKPAAAAPVRTERELRVLAPVVESGLEGVKFAIETQPGTRVGGDFYDIINLSDNFAAFLIADVSGYGLPAAVIMATGRLAFRTYSANELSPRLIMGNVNKALLRSTLAGHYLTAFLAVLDTELLTLQYVNASHCSPFLIRAGEATPLDTEGLFVGMFEDPQYEQKGMQLEQHDRLFFYTDGLLRGFEGEDRQESQMRLQRHLRDHAELGIDELVDQLAGLMSQPEDDVALMGLELLLEKAQRKQIVIPSLPRELTHAENAILPVLENEGYGERAIFAVKLALEEAAINAIKHGNELDDTKKVVISFSIDDNKAVISVADEGEGFNPSDVPDPTAEDYLMATSGRGIALMNAYMDEVRYNDSGNEVIMIEYAPWAAVKHT
jgi:serine/threonine-protein kinase RsbW